MHGSTVMTKDLDDGKSKLNKDEPQINRGVELFLRNRRRRSEQPKTFQVKFGKMISLFHREFHFLIDIHFDVRKHKFSGEEKC